MRCRTQTWRRGETSSTPAGVRSTLTTTTHRLLPITHHPSPITHPSPRPVPTARPSATASGRSTVSLARHPRPPRRPPPTVPARRRPTTARSCSAGCVRVDGTISPACQNSPPVAHGRHPHTVAAGRPRTRRPGRRRARYAPIRPPAARSPMLSQARLSPTPRPHRLAR